MSEFAARDEFAAQEKWRAVERELAFRRHVYARLVGQGKMKQEKMDQEIAIFEAIAADYLKQAETERLL